jgi:hypothetical protein
MNSQRMRVRRGRTSGSGIGDMTSGTGRGGGQSITRERVGKADRERGLTKRILAYEEEEEWVENEGQKQVLYGDDEQEDLKCEEEERWLDSEDEEWRFDTAREREVEKRERGRSETRM